MAEPVGPPDTQNPDQIWSFRGYRLSPGEFNTAMVHFYRGEITRSNTWRTRLDATTNWAVVATGAALSFAFSEPTHSHIMIPINTMLITLFLYIEARRYRYYELWAYRVRLMESDFFAAMLAPPFQPGDTWASRIAQSLLHPTFTISFFEAFGRRFRRNYQFIYALLALAWFVKILIHPVAVTDRAGLLANAAVGPFDGPVVLVLGLAFNSIIFAIGWLTAGLRESKGEVLRQEGLSTVPMDIIQSAGDALMGHGVQWASKREELAYIIATRQSGAMISERILKTLGRGVTAVDGRGMYTGEERMILFVAIHPNQVLPLKHLVRDIDPSAFVIIHRAEEVIGRGFHAPS